MDDNVYPENKRPSFKTEEIIEENTANPALTVQPPEPKENIEDQTNPGSDQSLTSLMENNKISSAIIPPPPRIKKPFPKMIIILIIILLILGILATVSLFLKRGETVMQGQKGELVWWGLAEDETIYKPLIEEFQTKNPNVKVIYKKQSSQNYRERLSSKFASRDGDKPDIFEIHNTWAPMFKNELYPVPNSVMGREEFTNTYYPVVVSDFTINNRIVALPLQYDALTLYINEDLFLNAAKTPPSTWPEFFPLATDKVNGLTIIQNDKIIQSGAAIGITDNVDYWPEIVGLILLQNQANPAKVDSAQVKEAILYYKSFVTDNTSSWNKALPRSTLAFARGQLAMYFGTTKSAEDILSNNPNMSFRTVALPQLPKNDSLDPDVSYATYWAQAVYNKSVNRDLAWSFIKYMSSAESLMRINQGRKELNRIQRVYPRTEMAGLQAQDRILGSVIQLANSAKSWYLVDQTNDGENGINNQVNLIYKEVIDGRNTNETQLILTTRMSELLAKYGIVVN